MSGCCTSWCSSDLQHLSSLFTAWEGHFNGPIHWRYLAYLRHEGHFFQGRPPQNMASFIEGPDIATDLHWLPVPQEPPGIPGPLSHYIHPSNPKSAQNCTQPHIDVEHLADFIPDWWFGTAFIFHILGISSSQLTTSYSQVIQWLRICFIYPIFTGNGLFLVPAHIQTIQLAPATLKIALWYSNVAWKIHHERCCYLHGLGSHGYIPATLTRWHVDTGTPWALARAPSGSRAPRPASTKRRVMPSQSRSGSRSCRRTYD